MRWSVCTHMQAVRRTQVSLKCGSPRFVRKCAQTSHRLVDQMYSLWLKTGLGSQRRSTREKGNTCWNKRPFTWLTLFLFFVFLTQKIYTERRFIIGKKNDSQTLKIMWTELRRTVSTAIWCFQLNDFPQLVTSLTNPSWKWEGPWKESWTGSWIHLRPIKKRAKTTSDWIHWFLCL